jgi:response regulator NasT
MGVVVKPVDEATLIPAIEIAISKFRKMEKLTREYNKTKLALEDRKFVDRAKALMMEKRGMSEKDAYEYMRKVAMDKGCTIAEIAKIMIRAN